MSDIIRRLCVIGVGLIGGSVALALRRAGVVDEVVGCGRSRDNLERALAIGAIDRFETDPARAVVGADMILVTVPLGAMAKIFAAIADSLAADAVITDGGSAKGCVVADGRATLGERIAALVPGHPIAGNERSGADAAMVDLFVDRRVILTPIEENSQQAIERVRALWRATGATVEEMSVEHHDWALAATSHLPHMLAFALVDSLARMEDEDTEEIFRYAAGGFRDFTRIASSDPVMWRDICLHNRAPLGEMLRRFQRDLTEIERAVEEGDAETLLTIFKRAKSARDAFSQPKSGN